MTNREMESNANITRDKHERRVARKKIVHMRVRQDVLSFPKLGDVLLNGSCLVREKGQYKSGRKELHLLNGGRSGIPISFRKSSPKWIDCEREKTDATISSR